MKTCVETRTPFNEPSFTEEHNNTINEIIKSVVETPTRISAIERKIKDILKANAQAYIQGVAKRETTVDFNELFRQETERQLSHLSLVEKCLAKITEWNRDIIDPIDTFICQLMAAKFDDADPCTVRTVEYRRTTAGKLERYTKIISIDEYNEKLTEFMAFAEENDYCIDRELFGPHAGYDFTKYPVTIEDEQDFAKVEEIRQNYMKKTKQTCDVDTVYKSREMLFNLAIIGGYLPVKVSRKMFN